MKKLLRAALLVATSTLVVCGVKAPPRPPEAAGADAGPAAPAGGADAGPAANPGPDGGSPDGGGR